MNTSDHISRNRAMDPVSDRIFLCEKNGIPAFTDFYDPASWTKYLETARKKVQAEAFGGDEDCERRMLGFQPVRSSDRLDFPIKRLRISHNSKFNNAPGHRDYLGSLVGLGFDRGKIGDIFISEEYADVFVHGDIADYVCEQLEKVGRVPVKVRPVSDDDEGVKRPPEVESQVNIASLRLDAVVAAVFRLSRGQVSGLVQGEKVFVNWAPCVDRGRQVKAGDVLTLRGYGRVKVGEVLGESKKGRLRVRVYR